MSLGLVVLITTFELSLEQLVESFFTCFSKCFIVSFCSIICRLGSLLRAFDLTSLSDANGSYSMR